jgi:hypothetical protein
MNSSAELSFAEQLQRFRDRTTKQRGQFRALILPGTQELEFPPDPYTVFGDLEAQEAQ